MEEWKPIEDYEDKYLISNKGRVKSLRDHKGKRRELILTPRKAKNGYLYLGLWRKGQCKSKKIHRLVAENFIHNPLNLSQVNHIDGNKENNSVENLEWCSAKENVMHAIKLGLRDNFAQYGKDNYMYKRHGKDNPHSKPVVQIDLKGNRVAEWENIKIAQQTLHIGHISNVCMGKRKTAGGYIWQYK